MHIVVDLCGGLQMVGRIWKRQTRSPALILTLVSFAAIDVAGTDTGLGRIATEKIQE